MCIIAAASLMALADSFSYKIIANQGKNHPLENSQGSFETEDSAVALGFISPTFPAPKLKSVDLVTSTSAKALPIMDSPGLQTLVLDASTIPGLSVEAAVTSTPSTRAATL